METTPLLCRVCSKEIRNIPDKFPSNVECVNCGAINGINITADKKCFINGCTNTLKSVIYESTIEIEKLQNKISFLRDMQNLFPDLVERTDRWNNERYSSKMANSRVTNCDFGHSCGCCDDSLLYAYPYLEIGSVKIYSDPDRVPVGEKCGYYDEEYENWKQTLEKLEINKDIVVMIEEYFKKQKDERREELESELEGLAE